jgi:fido (protein-threonine AMPylation protein)
MGLELEYINGQTLLDEDEKAGLKIQTITTRKELDEFEQFNIQKAVEWSLSRKLKIRTILTEKFIKDLHKRMFLKYGSGQENSENRIKISASISF